MNIAIAIGTAVLGGWVLNGPEEELPTIAEQPQAAAPAQPAPTAKPITQGNPRGDTMLMPQDTGRMRNRMAVGTSERAMRLGADGVVAPTEALPNGVDDIPLPPTMNDDPSRPLPRLGNTYGNMGQMYQRDQRLMSPTDRRGGQLGYHPTSRSGVGQVYRAPTQGMNSPLLTPPIAQGYNQPPQPMSPNIEKAFSSYRPTSGVSPYMNLFRTNTGGVDNYNTLVKPELEQRRLNQQFNRDIGGLERNTNQQLLDLRRRYEATHRQPVDNSQGVGTPQFYMQTQNGQ
jgi:hypothetical protein